MKEERYKYFDDEELEALIEEVERSGMIAPPVYLKELIMGTACGKTKWNRRGRLARENISGSRPEGSFGFTVLKSRRQQRRR